MSESDSDSDALHVPLRPTQSRAGFIILTLTPVRSYRALEYFFSFGKPKLRFAYCGARSLALFAITTILSHWQAEQKWALQ